MHEVIHLSFGPQANELNSSFYNKQTDYFVYKKEDLEKSHIDPNIRFVYGKEYTPRALFWEYRNGFGNWKRYNEKYEASQEEQIIAKDQSLPVVKQDIKSSAHFSSSWTSRLKVPVHPHNMSTIPDWEIDYQTAIFGRQRGAPEGQDRQFDLFDEGEEQFKACQLLESMTKEDYMDTHFRPVLEKCDSLDGINSVTDLGGWSGFTSSVLETMRDEYLPRQSVFTWCISRNIKPKFVVQASRIEALVRFTEFSSSVLPFQDTLQETNFEANAQQHLPEFETTCLSSSSRHNRVSMHTLYQDLTTDTPAANIVQVGANKSVEFGSNPGTKIRNTVKIYRGSVTPPAVDGRTSANDRSQNYKQYWFGQPKNFEMVLNIDNSPLQSRKLVSRSSHGSREQVYDLTEPYVWGWNDDLSDDEYA